MSLDVDAILVSEFREMMDDIMGFEIPSEAHCAAVIRHVANQLPEGPEIWAIWHVETASQVATLCEFDGSICYESYPTAWLAWREAEKLNAKGYSQSGVYVVARIPAGVAGMHANKQVRASGPTVAWSAGVEHGYTVCRAAVADLSPLKRAPDAPTRRALSLRKAYRLARVTSGAADYRFPDERPAPLDGAPITRLCVFERDDKGEMSLIELVEADMTASHFQAHFMRGTLWCFAKTERAKLRTYTLDSGTYRDGSAVFPFADQCKTHSRI